MKILPRIENLAVEDINRILNTIRENFNELENSLAALNNIIAQKNPSTYSK